MLATKMYSTPQTENKTLPRCVHILCTVVLIGVQRVNEFKSGRGSSGLLCVQLFPQTHCAVSDTTKRVLFQLISKRISFLASLPKTAVFQKCCALCLLSSDPLPKWVHPVPGILIALLRHQIVLDCSSRHAMLAERIRIPNKHLLQNRYLSV